ncbi:hypothetical protein HUU53_01920 [Candidatus Micrarchaeota archaeon]|nr:hypothetical protein [Candidatus Micrarchaeota archaeon]
MPKNFLLSPSELKLLRKTLDRHERPRESDPYHRLYFRPSYHGVSATREQVKQSTQESQALHSLLDSLPKKGFRLIKTSKGNSYYSNGFVIVKTLDKHVVLKFHQSDKELVDRLTGKNQVRRTNQETMPVFLTVQSCLIQHYFTTRVKTYILDKPVKNFNYLKTALSHRIQGLST